MLVHPQNSSQPGPREDAAPTPPPGEFPDQSTYFTTQPNTSSRVGPEPQMIPDSLKEEDSRVKRDLGIPSINITSGTPPLLLSETALVVEQSETNLNNEENNGTSMTGNTANVTEDATNVTSLTEGSGITDVNNDTGMTSTNVTEVTNVSEGTSGLMEEAGVTREETKEARSTRGTNSNVEAHVPGLTEVANASLTEAASSTMLPDDKLKRQSSERRGRSQVDDKPTRRRVRSSERGSESREGPSKVTRTSGPLSERVSRRRSADISTLMQKHTADKSPDAKNAEHSTINEANKSYSDGEQSISLPSPAHRNLEEPPSLNSAQSSTSSLVSLPTTEEHSVAPNDHPPCTLGEKIMVETSVGFKFGKVKFIGPTEFSAGEWIGIALERPLGKLASLLDTLNMLYFR